MDALPAFFSTGIQGAPIRLGPQLTASRLIILGFAGFIVLGTLLLKLPWASAQTTLHARIIKRVGADYVVQPEKEFGALAARRLAYPGTLDYLQLGEDEAVVEVEVPEEWVGKSISDLHLYRKSGLTVLAHKSRGRKGNIPKGDESLQEEDVLVICGSKEDIDKSDLFQQ